jgi:hypothetical protein
MYCLAYLFGYGMTLGPLLQAGTPLNVLLVHLGVKGGMPNPREAAAGMSGHAH